VFSGVFIAEVDRIADAGSGDNIPLIAVQTLMEV
jgi:hypothetical protein